MSNVKFLPIRVKCPDDPRVTRTMKMLSAETDAGPLASCNGCDFYGSNAYCEKCVAALSLLFTKFPDTPIFDPIRPDIGQFG